MARDYVGPVIAPFLAQKTFARLNDTGSRACVAPRAVAEVRCRCSQVVLAMPAGGILFLLLLALLAFACVLPPLTRLDGGLFPGQSRYWWRFIRDCTANDRIAARTAGYRRHGLRSLPVACPHRHRDVVGCAGISSRLEGWKGRTLCVQAIRPPYSTSESLLNLPLLLAFGRGQPRPTVGIQLDSH